MKLLVVLLFLFNIASQAATQNRDQIVRVIDLELAELVKINKVSKGSDPETLLRIAELYLEKGRILREDENEDFFSRSVDERRKIDKKKFYEKSQNYFQKSQEAGVYLAKRYPSYRNIGDAYYILAFNEKENNNFQKSKDLFILATKKSKTGTPTDTKSRLALGDIYYGEGDFRKAKAYYDSAISKIKDDKWYTRYLYNLSWSNFRVGNKKLATSQMQDVYRLSSDKKYIDKKEMASRDIGYFLADAGNLKKATAFYKQVGGNSAKNFYDMGKQLQDKQKYSDALKFFNNSYGVADGDYSNRSFVEILTIYDKYNNNENFIKYAREIKKVKLNEEQTKEVIFLLKKRAALLGKELNLSHNKKRPEVAKLKASQASELFMLTKEVDPSFAEAANFFAAEANYSVGNFDEALSQYDYVLNNSKDSTMKAKALEGMMISINSKGISKKARLEYFEKTYLAFIRNTNDQDKKNKALEKLFSFTVEEKGDVKNAEEVFFTIQTLTKLPPTKNEAMIGRIVDMYKKKDDKTALLGFVGKLKDTNVAITSNFLKSLEKIVLITQFEDVQNANQKGDKVFALRGYLAIYSDKNTTIEAKRNAAYNIAVLFYEKGNIHFMSQWLQRAISEMQPGELTNFTDSIYLMINELYLRQRFDEGLKITEDFLEKTCALPNNKKDELLKNYMIMGLAHNKERELKSFVSKQKICKNGNVYSDIHSQFLDYYIDVNDLGAAENEFDLLTSVEKDNVTLIRNLGSLIKAIKESGKSVSSNLQSKFNAYSSRIRDFKYVGVDAVDLMAEARFSRIQALSDQVNNIKLAFPEAKFKNLMMRKLNALNTFTGSAADVLKLGSGDGVVKTYKLLIDTYNKTVTEIATFKPEGKPQEYVDAFSKNMLGVTTPLTQKIKTFESELNEQVDGNFILSDLMGEERRSGVGFVHDHESVLMDKRGQQ